MENIPFEKNYKLLFFCLLIALYAYSYVYLIPWDTLKEFSDIKNYLSSMLFYKQEGTVHAVEGISFIVSEWLWKFILLQLSYFSDTKNILYIVSFFGLSVYSYFTLKKVHYFVVFLFFFNPMFIDLVLGQIRILLAFSLLLIAFQISSKKSILFILMAILIHASSILFIGIYFILKLMNNVFKNRNFYFYSILLSLILALFLKYGVDIFLIALEDKRANYADKISGNSVKYSIFWFLVSITLAINSYTNEHHEKLKIIIAFSITMTSLFFFSSLLGSYGQRYVAVSIPLIIISIYHLPSKYAWGLFSIFALWQLFQYFYWFNLYNYL